MRKVGNEKIITKRKIDRARKMSMLHQILPNLGTGDRDQNSCMPTH